MSTTTASAAPAAARDPLLIVREAQVAAGGVAAQLEFMAPALKAFADAATELQERAALLPNDFQGKVMLQGTATGAIQLPAMLQMALSAYKPA